MSEADEELARLPHSVLDRLHEGCQVIGPDFRYLYVNAAAAEHGRTTPAALLGRTMMAAYPGIDATPMFAGLRRCLAAGVAEQLENEFVFPDGTRAWFELRFQPVPQGVAILSRDITAHRQSEEEHAAVVGFLRLANECDSTRALVERAIRFFRQALDFEAVGLRLQEGDDYPYFETSGFSPEFVQLERSLCRRDRDGAVVRDADQHPALDCMCGNVIRGRVDPAKPFFTPGGSFWSNRTTRLLATTTDEDRLARTRNRCNGEGYESVALIPLRGREQCLGLLQLNDRRPGRFTPAALALYERLAGHLAVALAKTQADEARAESERRTRAICDHLPHPTFIWQQRGTGFALVSFNAAARAVTRGGVARFLGRDAADLPHHFPGLVADLERCCRERASHRRELDFTVTGSPQPRRLEVVYGFMPPDMVLLHADDVTDQRRTEEQLRLSQRLDAIGRLAGGVAHDFNNLLAIILSYTGFALESLRPGDPLHDDLLEVRKAGESAAALTRQLLAFSRRQVLQPQVVALNATVRQLESMLRRLLGESIDLVTALADDLGRVQADPGQLEQVVMNLAVNARDAMPQGGYLTIETRNVELDEAYAAAHVAVRPGAYVMLAVSDSGCGMDEATRTRIFEPFFTTKGPGAGTGLGLATVYGIVKQSGGNIWVYSELGRGTTFKVYLPRELGAAEPASCAAAPPPAAGGTETVLVVEDEPVVRNLACRILRAAGYTVLPAANGGEALLACERHPGPVHLMLTDVVMPQMSGRELANRLARVRPGLRVLYMSGYTDNAIVHHGVLDRDLRFIAKPFSSADLLRLVRGILDANPAEPRGA